MLFARAVFFNRQGDLRDRSFENQRHRARGLNLIVAAIVLWNTVYLERATPCAAPASPLMMIASLTCRPSAENTST